MLLEREIKVYLKTTCIPQLVQQIPADYTPQQSLLSFTMPLDLNKTRRQNPLICQFVIGDYHRFTQLVEESTLEAMNEAKLELPDHGLNITYGLSNCPLQRLNLESIDFISAALQQEKGVLVYLKDVHILQVSQPQMYLFSWQEVWTSQCGCSNQRLKHKKHQTLLDIMRTKTKNMKEASVGEIPRCEQCSAKMIRAGLQEKIFLNCQKARVHVEMKELGGGKESVFQRGQMDIIIQQSNMEKFKEGDIIDMCCYYTAEPLISKIVGQEISLRCQSMLMLISCYPSAPFSSKSSHFFTELAGLDCEYIKCDDPRDEETVCYNYNCLISTINQIRFPYLSQSHLSTIKLLVLNSLFNQKQLTPLHLLIVTDEVTLLQRALRPQGISVKRWPTLYDDYTLTLFLHSCHNSIIIIPNPCKKDCENINKILTHKLLKQINFTIWIVTEPTKDLKKDLSLDRIHVVMDLSAQKNFNICKNVYDTMIDDALESFMEKEEGQIVHTVPKKQPKRGNQTVFLNQNFQGIQAGQQQMIRENAIAHKIMEKYFLKARQYKHMNSNSLTILKQVADGFGYFRQFLRNKGKRADKEVHITILDAILAIFIQEESSRHKIGPSNTLFSNDISKLMLNEGDCELSFWDLQVNESHEYEENHRLVHKDVLFKRMIGKLMAFLYNNEVI